MLTRAVPAVMPVERFHADLASVCGSFDIVPADGQRQVRGKVCRCDRAGLEIATVAKDVRTVRRTAAHVRREPGDHVFLIVQEEGQALMQQDGFVTMMREGDMVLIDSLKPSEFNFFGKYSRHLSVHLGRSELQDRFRTASFSGKSIRRTDYHAVALAALLRKVFEDETSEVQSLCLKEAIIGVIGAVLHDTSPREGYRGLDGELASARILEQAMAYVDRCFEDSELSAGNLAAQICVPLRQLQRAFALAGTTPTDYLTRKRMEKACRLLARRKAGGAKTRVSSIAFQCGFNDVSYFNRQFRKAFGCSPGCYPSPPDPHHP